MESIHHINNYIESEYEKGNIYASTDMPLFHKNLEEISKFSFVKYFERLNDTCGLGRQGTYRFFRSHNLRKFFASTLRSMGYDSLDTEFLLGHKVRNSLQDTYIKRDLKRMEQQYLRVMPKLSLTPVKTNVVASQEYQELKQQYEQQQKVIEQIQKDFQTMKDDHPLASSLIEQLKEK